MKTPRVTQEYIAQQLNISRNTVSKVFNNHPGISEQTRQIVMSKASELNYRSGIPNTENHVENAENSIKDVAFVCPENSLVEIFWTIIVKNTELILSNNNINFRLVIIRKSDEIMGNIPSSLISPPPFGVIMVGLFNSSYYKKIIELGHPLVTFDITPDIVAEEKKCDVVLVEDFNSTYRLTQRLINKGHTNIVFAGDKSSCYSFYRRWKGYREAMLDNGLTIPTEAQFDFPDENRHYSAESIYKSLKNVENKPTAFVCANDLIANAVNSLRFPPYNILDTVAIAGFDNYKGVHISSPEFSTVDVHLKDIGKTLGEQIIWRINNPNRKHRLVEVESTIITND